MPAWAALAVRPSRNIDYETWTRVLDINALGPMRVAEAFVDNVARSDRKLIVTITSGMGSMITSPAPHSPIAARKLP